MLTIEQADGLWPDAVTAGQKSGIVHKLDRLTGDIVWQTDAGPGGTTGGMTEDGERVFTNINNKNLNFTDYRTLVESRYVGRLGGVNASTGEVIWSTANLDGHEAYAPLTYVNGIVLTDVLAIDICERDSFWHMSAG